jgi:hypothetical protein
LIKFNPPWEASRFYGYDKLAIAPKPGSVTYEYNALNQLVKQCSRTRVGTSGELEEHGDGTLIIPLSPPDHPVPVEPSSPRVFDEGPLLEPLG